MLDGTYNLDAVRKADEYGLTYEIGEIELHEGFHGGSQIYDSNLPR